MNVKNSRFRIISTILIPSDCLTRQNTKKGGRKSGQGRTSKSRKMKLTSSSSQMQNLSSPSIKKFSSNVKFAKLFREYECCCYSEYVSFMYLILQFVGCHGLIILPPVVSSSRPTPQTFVK